MTNPRLSSVLGVAVVTLALAACGSNGSSDQPTLSASTPPASTPAASTPAAAGGPCAPMTAPSHTPQHFDKEPAVTTAAAPYTLTMVTNCGTIVARLDGAKAPHTVNSFAFLASKHYFDDSACHRLTTQGIYVLQCGDPSGAGTGGPGYTIPDENLAGATYPAGTLAMANTGQPHTGGSQFFLCYANTQLPPQYTPFGVITSGLDVLKAIAAAGEDDSNGPGDGHPKTPVVIKTFTVVKA